MLRPSAGAGRRWPRPSGPATKDPVPEIRPFRALRYADEAVPDIAAVVSPPYDVITPTEQAALLARDPRNIVRLDLPAEERGDEPDDRYRRAARTLAAWRSDGTLRKDPRPAVYVYEQTYRCQARTASGPSAGSSPASGSSFTRDRCPAPRADDERPEGGPLQAPPSHGHEPQPGRRAVRGRLRSGRRRSCPSIAAGPAEVDLTDDDGVRHRLWTTSRRAGRGGRPGARADLGRGPPAGHDRRRPSSLRDRPAVPRRTADESLVRGGPAVRLSPGPVPRGDRDRPDGPADPPRRPDTRHDRAHGPAGSRTCPG